MLKEGAEVLTRSVTRSYGEISYFLDDEVEENPKASAATAGQEETKTRSEKTAKQVKPPPKKKE